MKRSIFQIIHINPETADAIGIIAECDSFEHARMIATMFHNQCDYAIDIDETPQLYTTLTIDHEMRGWLTYGKSETVLQLR